MKEQQSEIEKSVFDNLRGEKGNEEVTTNLWIVAYLGDGFDRLWESN
jgi:hypothetical protein